MEIRDVCNLLFILGIWSAVVLAFSNNVIIFETLSLRSCIFFGCILSSGFNEYGCDKVFLCFLSIFQLCTGGCIKILSWKNPNKDLCIVCIMFKKVGGTLDKSYGRLFLYWDKERHIQRTPYLGLVLLNPVRFNNLPALWNDLGWTAWFLISKSSKPTGSSIFYCNFVCRICYYIF